VRDLLVQLVVYLSLPIIPFRPFLGLLVFSWLAYMRPQNLAWGLQWTHFSDWVAIATFLGLAYAVPTRREKLLTFRPQTILLIALWAWVGIALLQAVSPETGFERFELFSKVIVISLITTGLVRTYDRFRVLLLVIAFSLGLLGLKYALFALVRGGARFVRGPGGFMGDNNGLAMGLAMAVPLLWGIAMAEERRPIRVAAAVLAASCALAVVFTFSRGGLLALLTVAFLLMLHLKRPLVGGLVMVLVAIGLLQFTSEDVREAYLDRAATIQSYEEDSSAMGRIGEWKTAGRIFRDYPLTGVGPDNLRVVHRQYSDAKGYKVTHNAFFQFLVEAGLPATLLFVALVAVSIWRMQRLRAKAEIFWIGTYARVLQISLVGYLVGAAFLDMAYYDLFYHLVGLSVSLEVAAAAAGQPSPTKKADDAIEVPWWKRPLGSDPVA
jgi:probable O-glycosylation ligase (exosortase A-associated)